MLFAGLSLLTIRYKIKRRLSKIGCHCVLDHELLITEFILYTRESMTWKQGREVADLYFVH